MKIIEAIPCILAPEKRAEGIIYIENDNEHQTLASKIAKLKEYDFDFAVFRHQDTITQTPEAILPNCERMSIDNVGIGGVIGTRLLTDSCAWWMVNRGIHTAGAIVQGDGRGGDYVMADQPGYHPDMVSVDGCWVIFSKKFVDAYEPHEFHWRFGYDSDACLQCLSMGMNVATLDIRVKHESQGGFDQNEFNAFREKFLGYWKPRVDFPVIISSEFRNVASK